MTTFENLLNCNPRSELARRNILDFVTYVNKEYEVNWHHALICQYLDRFINGEITRLMVFTPPQHGKSQLVSRSAPAYILGKNPKAKVVIASYSADLASSFNRDCQRIIESDEYRDIFSQTRLNDSKGEGWIRTTDRFDIVGHGGFLKSVGVGGSLTGTPADFAIIDDPVKDAIEAASSTTQQRIWDWYTSVLKTRLHNNSRVLLTMTRWDVNDLAGKLLQGMEDGGEQWVILRLPAIKTAEEHNGDPRQFGEPLWPARHSLEKLQASRKESARVFEALYQQNPRPVKSGGEFWKHFSAEKHVKAVQFEKSSMVHVSVDENVVPYITQSIWQASEKDRKVRQVGEIACKSPDNTAAKAARKFAAWLTDRGYKGAVSVWGDPSGGKRTTDENNASFFDKYIAELKACGFIVHRKVARSAPQVAVSAAFINELYEHEYGGWGIEIGQDCPLSITDYEVVKEDKEGKMVKTKAKDVNTGDVYEPYGHFSDVKRYLITGLLAVQFSNYTQRSRRMGSVAA